MPHADLSERESLLATMAAGPEAAWLLSAATDRLVAGLAASAPAPPGRFALCALGGWGAGSLLPRSDLDLLVLSEANARELAPFVEAVLYPLWDAGLKVGHQVRSPQDHFRECRREALETLTASLTGRTIAGDPAFGDGVLAAVAADAYRRRPTVLASLARRPRPGSPFLLVPNLKEGAGGRRDYDELVWTASVVSGVTASSPQRLVAAGLLSAEELVSIEHARDLVTAARWESQLAGHGDVLAPEAAEALAIEPERVQSALATTWVALNRVRRRVGESDHDEHAPLRLTEVAAIARRGPDAADELLEAAQTGRLDAIISGMSDLMTARRPGLGHTLTVGAHCIAAACELAGLGAARGPLARSASLVEDRDALLVAALTHDAGKTDPGPGHAERGAPSAHAAARSAGLSEASARTAADLVEHHLVLIETALAHDLDDEDVILRCAARIGRRELIAPLHLLTAADTMATGPSSWTPWLGAMVAELVVRLDAALAPDVDGTCLVSRAEEVRLQALGLVSTDPPAVATFLEAAPARYLATRTPAEALRDARLVSSLRAAGYAQGAHVAVGAGPTDDTGVVTIAARDRPYLLSRLAGALSLAGLDILAFDAHGATGHIALDTFTVRSATERPLAPEVFTRLERLLDAALRDRYELATRLAERRRHYPTTRSAPPRVEIARGGWDTTVSVTVPDRPGLLHDLALAVSATGLDIRWARARTVDGLARDVFHVVGPDGGPVDDPGVLGHLAMRLRAIAEPKHRAVANKRNRHTAKRPTPE